MTRLSWNARPRARRARPRNSLQPARVKKIRSGAKTGAQGTSVAATTRTTPLIRSLVRIIARSDRDPATRACEAVPWSPRSAASAATRATAERAPKVPVPSTPSTRGIATVVVKP